jgi:glycosyltransferase involved in cell wall biosynthesis
MSGPRLGEVNMTIRVAMLVDSPSRRAHGNAASRLALGLVETGRVEVTLLCYGADPPPEWLPAAVRIHRLGVDRASRSLPGIVRYLRTQEPDVLITRQVHANFVALAAAWMARVPPRWRGKLVLVQDHLVELSHGSNWRDNKWLAKVSYRFADGVIAPSPTVRENVIRWCGLDPSLAAVVPNPIPKFSGTLASPPHPWLRGGEPPVFVNVSNMLPFKRVDLLIDAFADLRQSHDARLLILGDGPGRSQAVEQIRQLGLTSHAEAVGWIHDPLQFAARAWALVHPSDQDGFAQVLTEAMSVGCPVITADAMGGGPRFVTDNGRYGLLVPRGDQKQLVEAMVRMLQTDVRARYSGLGQHRIKAMSPIASANALVDFLTVQLGLHG